MAWSKKRIVVVVIVVLVLLNGATFLILHLLTPPRADIPTVAPASETLLAYEPFDYPADTLLVGQNGGSGFGALWEPGGFNATVSDVFTTKPGALTFSNLATRGTQHLSIAELPPGNSSICGVGRLFPTNLATVGATYYLSFLHRVDAEGGYGSVVLGTGRGRELAIGRSRSSSMFHLSQRGGAGRVHTTEDALVGQTTFLVAKLEFMDGPDRFTLHINPPPGQPEPAGGAVKDDMDLAEVTHLFLYSRSAWSVDEIRLGTTWESVTPALNSSAGR